MLLEAHATVKYGCFEVTFEAERAVRREIGSVVGVGQSAFEELMIGRSVRTIGTCATITRPRIIVVAVGAFDDTAGRPRGNQAWRNCAGIGAFHGVVGGIGCGELGAGIEIIELPSDGSRSLRRVGMTTKTDFVFVGCRIYRIAGEVHAWETSKGSSDPSRYHVCSGI